MITLFVALYSLLCLCTTGKTSAIKELQVKILKHGENVTMECKITGDKKKDNLVWYKQIFGQVPQLMAKTYSGSLGYTFAGGFEDSRFNITLNDQKFNLSINKIREDDGGEYFCGELEGTVLKFTSGTRLQFEGEEMKPCPTPGTLNKNTHSVTLQGSNSSDGEEKVYWIIVLTASNIISVIVIVALVGVLFKHRRKGASSSNHQTPTNQADDENVLNYAAVSFAKKPSFSRTSRDTSYQDVYAQVKIK